MTAKVAQYRQEKYDHQVPFTGLLPGISGLDGRPIWAFYVNRGQGICSFGIHDKAHAIMEFQPAVRAYEDTEINGFRTFLRIKKDEGTLNVEPFAHEEDRFVKNLEIYENRFFVEAISESLGLAIRINYFVLPNLPFGGLVRRVRLHNIGTKTLSLEGLDGMPRLIPYGILNDEHMALANILRSFATVQETKSGLPIFTLRSATSDTDRVERVEGGIFVASNVKGAETRVLSDRKNIFGEWSTLRSPGVFYHEGLEGVLAKEQVHVNKLPCAFTPFRVDLVAGDGLVLEQIYGYTDQPDELTLGFSLEDKQDEADHLLDGMLNEVKTRTSIPLFDQYIRQSYLDNILRGGYPVRVKVGSEDYAIHVYSRKHGDPERDYNFFATAYEPWSQGNGSFRDVCQNRRNDVFFHPEAGLQNAFQFLSLVQADGYNPLEIEGVTFRIREDAGEGFASWLIGQSETVREQLKMLQEETVTPGYLFGIEGLLALDELFSYLEPVTVAAFKEGYWVDHWVYLQDLLEGLLAVYPDRVEEILYCDDTLTFYQSAYRVKPRSERYFEKDSSVRQYDSVFRDDELYELFGETGRLLLYEDGSTVRIGVYAKLFLLASLKFSTLDPLGAGVEMEAGRPGWNDAMNGMPAFRGSSVTETLELKRLLQFLLRFKDDTKVVRMPEVMAEFCLNIEADWDKRNKKREVYRERISDRISTSTVSLSTDEIAKHCLRFLETIAEGLKSVRKLSQDFLPTFLLFDPEPRALPRFLEAPAKELKTLPTSEAKLLYELVCDSEIFDEKIGMYKTSESLEEETVDIGRVRTFTAGWLERESIFVHMHYKFLYGLLIAELYDEFFFEMQRGLLPFYDAEVYGRSPIEHCSFIASYVNLDPSLHGRGFINRLSGATAEVLSMWLRMFVGKEWFSYEEELSFTFSPILPDWLFTDDGEIRFTLLGYSEVIYKNPARRSTYGDGGVKPRKIRVSDGNNFAEISGASLPVTWAKKLRAGETLTIEVEFS